MIRRIFILFLSMLGTTIFCAVFFFLFANSVEMNCEKQPDKTFTCTIEKKLLGMLVTSQRTFTRVTGARTAQDCDSDGCSYRTELQIVNSGSQPFDDVYTNEGPVDEITAKINKSIAESDGPGFSVTADLQWWLVIMLGLMYFIGMAVETVMVFRAAYQGWMKRQWF